MKTTTEMYRELDRLTSEAVAQIYDALHDLKDVHVHAAALEVLWRRHARPGGEWPVRTDTIGDPTRDDFAADFEERPTHELIACCAGSQGPRDPRHQVAMHMEWSYLEYRGKRVFAGMQCTCGRRNLHHDGPGALQLRWLQATPSAEVWPIVMVNCPDTRAPDGIRRVPHRQVCRQAAHALDPWHAPNSVGTACLCGARLGRLDASDQPGKLLAVY